MLISKGFLRLPSSKLVPDWLKEEYDSKMQKLDFNSYESLQYELGKDIMRPVLEEKENEAALIGKPLNEWCGFLHELQNKAQI